MPDTLVLAEKVARSREICHEKDAVAHAPLVGAADAARNPRRQFIASIMIQKDLQSRRYRRHAS
jgi:hypothetical protein